MMVVVLVVDGFAYAQHNIAYRHARRFHGDEITNYLIALGVKHCVQRTLSQHLTHTRTTTAACCRLHIAEADADLLQTTAAAQEKKK